MPPPARKKHRSKHPTEWGCKFDNFHRPPIYVQELHGRAEQKTDEGNNYSGGSTGKQPKGKNQKTPVCEGYVSGKPVVYCYTHGATRNLRDTSATLQ